MLYLHYKTACIVIYLRKYSHLTKQKFCNDVAKVTATASCYKKIYNSEMYNLSKELQNMRYERATPKHRTILHQ